jgi:hypothetical protein
MLSEPPTAPMPLRPVSQNIFGLGSPVFNRTGSGMSRQINCQPRIPIFRDRCTAQ